MRAPGPLTSLSVRGRSARSRVYCSLAVVALSLGTCACSPADSPPDITPIPTSETNGAPQEGSPRPEDVPEAADTRLTTVLVDASGPTLVVATDAATLATPDSDTGSTVTTTVAGGGTDGATDDGTGPQVRYALTVPAGTTLDVGIDQTVALVGADGSLVAGLAAPVVVDATGRAVRASWDRPSSAGGPDDGTLAVDLALPVDAAFPVTVSVHLGTSVVAGTEWGDNEGGTSLAVTPSDWGRVSGLAGQAHGWADLVAVEPSADTTVMENQFRCHQLGAPDKATWNLEPWRPDVSFLAYVAARCNPG